VAGDDGDLWPSKHRFRDGKGWGGRFPEGEGMGTVCRLGPTRREAAGDHRVAAAAWLPLSRGRRRARNGPNGWAQRPTGSEDLLGLVNGGGSFGRLRLRFKDMAPPEGRGRACFRAGWAGEVARWPREVAPWL
jgi:hypothetical protein